MGTIISNALLGLKPSLLDKAGYKHANSFLPSNKGSITDLTVHFHDLEQVRIYDMQINQLGIPTFIT